MEYSAKLPSVSVIIIFHNEHLSTLLRTCVSVVRRTPAQLLNEIILVDDASSLADLRAPLTAYVESRLPIVRLHRTRERIGLIQARMMGARMATSDFLVFLDSHCEAYHNWLPPLLGLSNFVMASIDLALVVARSTVAKLKWFCLLFKSCRAHSMANGMRIF